MVTLGTQLWHWSPQLYGVQTLCLQTTANQKKVSLNGGGKELNQLVSVLKNRETALGLNKRLK